MNAQNKTPNKKKKKGPQPVYKPYLKGSVASKTAALRGRRILCYQLIFVLLYVMLGSVLSFESLALRIITNLFLVGACAALMYMDGTKQGEDDCAFAEIADSRLAQGKDVPDDDRDRCYHPLKGTFTFLVGMSPLVLLALVYAFMAKREAYVLQTLPSWVSGYTRQSEVGSALAYYNASYTLSFVDVLRTIIRFLTLPFVNIAGTYQYDAKLLVDRLSPLLVLIAPSFYALGYLQGPYLRALVHGNISSANKRRARREKKARQARRQKTNELI